MLVGREVDGDRLITRWQGYKGDSGCRTADVISVTKQNRREQTHHFGKIEAFTAAAWHDALPSSVYRARASCELSNPGRV